MNKSILYLCRKNAFLVKLSRDFFIIYRDCIDDKMVSMLSLSVVGHGLKPWLGQTKDGKICIYYFSAKHAALRSMSKD